jgi:hypothetical protein
LRFGLISSKSEICREPSTPLPHLFQRPRHQADALTRSNVIMLCQRLEQRDLEADARAAERQRFAFESYRLLL